jgi:hypothetical protein
MSMRLKNPMIAVVWLVFLLPGRFFGDSLDLALAWAVFALACVVLWTRPHTWESRVPARRALQLFGALQFLYVLSYLYASAFKGLQTGPRDLLELPRWLLLGGFVVYLIRHYDAPVRAATEEALAAAVYGSSLFFETAGERTYVAGLALVYMVLFSRSKLRWLHATAAAVVIALARARWAWASSSELLRHIRLSPALGWGPARYELASGEGSQYLLWLAKDGVLGAVLIGAGLVLATRDLLLDEEDVRRRAAAAAVLTCGAALLLTGPYLDSCRLFMATAFLLAAVHEPRRGKA